MRTHAALFFSNRHDEEFNSRGDTLSVYCDHTHRQVQISISDTIWTFEGKEQVAKMIPRLGLPETAAVAEALAKGVKRFMHPEKPAPEQFFWNTFVLFEDPS